MLKKIVVVVGVVGGYMYVRHLFYKRGRAYQLIVDGGQAQPPVLIHGSFCPCGYVVQTDEQVGLKMLVAYLYL